MSRSKRLKTGTLTRPLSFGATTGWARISSICSMSVVTQIDGLLVNIYEGQTVA